MEIAMMHTQATTGEVFLFILIVVILCLAHRE